MSKKQKKLIINDLSKKYIVPQRIIDLIKSNISSMSFKQRMIADYIISNPGTFWFLTVQDLAKKSCVSHATVVRFCQILGYKGFSEFTHDIQKIMRIELTVANTFSPSTIDEDIHSSQSSILKKIINTELESVRSMLKHISDEDIKQCVNLMEDSEAIYILARMSSYPISLHFYNTLSKACDKCFIVPENTLQASSILKQMNKKSLLFAVAYTRYSVDTVSFAEMAAQKSCKIICLTNSLVSPLVALADLKLIVPVTSFSFADLFAAQATLLTAISLEYGRCSLPRTEASLAEFNRIMLQRNHVIP